MLRFAVGHFVVGRQLTLPVVVVIRVVRVRSVGKVRRVHGSISLHICHKKYSVWALALKAIRL